MCGIAGIVGGDHVDEGVLGNMASRLRHRGPDDQGVWIDREAGLGFAHRRLSIIDLSPHGHQPMPSADGRMILCYNGEIYNHLDLRRQLAGEGGVPDGGWRGHSDSETLVEAFAHWGVAKTLSLAKGMFALAVWDRSTRTLHLARDRFGEKPLYYGWSGRTFLFASELKAFGAYPGFAGNIDRAAVAQFTSLGYIPAPNSIYSNIFKLEPGTHLSMTLEALGAPMAEPPRIGGGGDGISFQRYWSLHDVAVRGAAQPIDDLEEASDAVEQALSASIRRQLVADVPVGCFLSGGIDSSAVVALAMQMSDRPVATFTIGFEEQSFDESGHARAVARHLRTDHHEMIVTPSDALDVIPDLPLIYDEPFADSSQIPTFLVSRFAASKVKVALSGDGGDELFSGYRRHVLAPKMWNVLRRLPRNARQSMAALLGVLPHGLWDAAISVAGMGEGAGRKAQKAIRIARHADNLEDIYRTFIDEWWGDSPLAYDSHSMHGFLPVAPDQLPPAIQLAYLDALTYLPGDILTKIDRASMAVSLEGRCPYLDPDLADVAARIPQSNRIDGGSGKLVLRNVASRHIPLALIDRPKTGFGIPVGAWLRGPLRQWAEALLAPERLESSGLYDPAVVSRHWNAHLAGRHANAPRLWHILMMMAWLEKH